MFCAEHQIDALQKQHPAHSGQDIIFFIKADFCLSYDLPAFFIYLFLVPLQISHLIICSLGGGPGDTEPRSGEY